MPTESAPVPIKVYPISHYSRYKFDNLWHIYQSKSPCRETRALLSYREVGVESFELPTSSL